jgi:hypothetical protein
MIKGTDLELELETLIDRHGLTEVLNCLQGVCGLKSIHILENWPGTDSEPQAKAWTRAAKAIEPAWSKAKALGL